MPLVIIAWIIVAIFTLSAAGALGLVVYFVLLAALVPALFGHGLIQGMGAGASKGGWVSDVLFYGLLYLPLMGLNWLGSLMMITYAGSGRGLIPYDPWLNRVSAVVLGPMTHLAYGVIGANPAVHTPWTYAKMLISGEVLCVAIVGAVWLFMLYPLGVAIVREEKRKKVTPQ